MLYRPSALVCVLLRCPSQAHSRYKPGEGGSVRQRSQVGDAVLMVRVTEQEPVLRPAVGETSLQETKRRGGGLVKHFDSHTGHSETKATGDLLECLTNPPLCPFQPLRGEGRNTTGHWRRPWMPAYDHALVCLSPTQVANRARTEENRPGPKIKQK